MKSHTMLSSSRSKKACGSNSSKTAGVTAQQVAFELKQRVILSLNKVSDRDTHHIGVNDLENIANSLTQDGITPFISCIIDTDSEQKSAVRKECIRLMATLARCHGSMLLPHLGKMMSSIVKRLKDTDTVVRDACVEAVGVFANTVRSSLTVSSGGGESTFIIIVKPLFEALGEQNRYVQSGSALCLTRVIDETNDPPIPVLSQMMPRVVKLLKNPNFMAKPAVIELIRSIVQVGGASTEHSLSVAMTSILETLKCSDWITRKAASEALASIAVGSSGPFLMSLRTTCVRSLERCRFDKVKPVRDSILHALQCWKTLTGTGSTEPSEAGSSTKENLNGNYSDATSASNGRWRELSNRKANTLSASSCTTISVTSKKRGPSAIQKDCPNHVQNHHNDPTSNNWHAEISLPKAHTTSTAAKSAFDRTTYRNFGYDAKFDYDAAEDKVDFSSTSDLVSGNFETKHVTMDEGDSSTLTRSNCRYSVDEVDIEGSVITQEHKSLGSTVTEQSSPGVHECCLHTVSELTSIKKKLLEIDNKQSSLLKLLQVYIRNSGDSLSTLKMTVHNLENAVKKISNTISQNEKQSSKITMNNQNVTCSPRLSTTTPRPSVESNLNSRQTSSLKHNSKEVHCVNSFMKNRENNSAAKEGVKLLRDSRLNIVKNLLQKDATRRIHIDTLSSQLRESNHSASGIKHDRLEVKYGFWKQMKELLHSGDMESAYAEALCRDDDICLIELMNITGPVLERLSCEITAVLLGILTTLFLKQRFTDSIIPWFLQVVDLNIDQDPTQLFMSCEARMDFLYALLELAAMECIGPLDKTAVKEFATKLSQLWSEAPVRKALAPAKRGF